MIMKNKSKYGLTTFKGDLILTNDLDNFANRNTLNLFKYSGDLLTYFSLSEEKTASIRFICSIQ